MNEAFCENEECMVILYQIGDPEVEILRNCPNCGRYGRVKDEKKATHPVDKHGDSDDAV